MSNRRPFFVVVPILTIACISCVYLIYFGHFDNCRHSFVYTNEGETDRVLQKFYERQAPVRQKLLRQYLLKNITADEHFGTLYDGLVAEVVCGRLSRVGYPGDGGKWVCDPWRLPSNCVIYSLGVGPDVSFELDMDVVVERRCRMYSFDPEARLGQRLVDLHSTRFTFRPFKLSVRTDVQKKQYSLQDIQRMFAHRFIDILKIDIEGGEFDVLSDVLMKRSSVLCCQLLVEMHGTPSQVALLHQQLTNADFYLFSYEINGFHHTLAEYSFIHQSCFEQYGIHTVLSRNFVPQ